MRNLVIVIAIAAAAAAAWYFLFRPANAQAPAAMLTATAERGTLRLSVESTGRVISNLDVDIKCKASGEVTKVPYDVSDPVRKGELLVELDPVDEDRVVKQAEVALSAAKAKRVIATQDLEIATKTLETDRQRAEAAVKSALARAKDARARADRRKQLYDKGVGTPDDYESALAAAVQADMDVEVARVHQEELKTQELALELKRQQVALAEAAVEGDNINLSIARDRLIDTKVFAPMDGVIAGRNVQIGQIISSGISSITGGTTVLTLSDLSRIFVLASVDESDIGRVEVGQKAVIWADAFPGQTFDGKVIRIATRGVNISNVVTFEVKIEVLSETKSLLKPEMTANIDITTRTKENVLLLPVEAVRRRRGEASVLVSEGPGEPVAPRERAVKTGLTDGVKIEVTEGLREGECVVYAKSAPESRWNPSVRPPYIPGGPSPRKSP